MPPVDHEQHPFVGEQVTVAYREQNPEQADVLGYESNSEFLGGVGLILTAVFTTLGLILIVSGLRRRRRKKCAARTSAPVRRNCDGPRGAGPRR
jgi:hypothetical protein